MSSNELLRVPALASAWSPSLRQMDYQELQKLDDILADWRAETPVPEDVRRQVEAELDEAGLTAQGARLPGGPFRPTRTPQELKTYPSTAAD